MNEMLTTRSEMNEERAVQLRV